MTSTATHLTQDQNLALEKIRTFIESNTPAFILGGYAGTGKTTLLKRIAEQLSRDGYEVKLMAPTGRATKILREKTGLNASTIHSGIYDFSDIKEIQVSDEDSADSFRYYFDLSDNSSIANWIFIVDESSMISDDFSEGEFFRFGSGKLLSDLIEYTRIQHPESRNKLLFVGDPAQLAPPTNSKFSPAMSANYLLETFGLCSDSAVLSTVVRQDAGSGILAAAEEIRKGIECGYFNQFQIDPNLQDIQLVEPESFYQLFETAPGKKIVITYTNQSAHQLNTDLRRYKYSGDFPVRVGDVMLVAQNNHLTRLYNGEFGVINRCDDKTISREVPLKVAGGATVRVLLRWRLIELVYQDENGFKATKESYMLENFLYHKSNNLKPEEHQALYVDFKNRFPELKPGTQKFKEKLRSDPYFNALRLKFGFAVTCHKAQGGEWDSAFVFWDYARPANFDFWRGQQEKTGRNNADFFRWAYTAITRASSNLYCINPPAFTPYAHLAFTGPGALPGIQHLNGETPNITLFEVDQVMTATLDRLGIPRQPEALRAHCLSVLYQCRLAQIELTGWKQSNYEFCYSFRQGDKTASVKGWLRGNDTINPNYQKNPGATNSDDLFEIVRHFCQEYNRYRPEDPEAPVPAQPELDWTAVEGKPFLAQLYSDLKEGLRAKNIQVKSVDHLEYKERYTFERQGEKVLLDVEYNGQGFFGRVVPLPNPTPSALLLRDLETIFTTLKNQ